jgi:peptidoglycan/xylan/chitin deacetylase (PgdA/CDA1 family)
MNAGSPARRVVPILLYHSLTAEASAGYRSYALDPARFRDHIAFLAGAGFTTLTVRELARAYRDPAANWPERPVVLTFDDGFEEMTSVALPVLANVGFRASFYVVSGSIGGTSGWLSHGEDARRLMDWPAIRDLAAAGHEIGAHGHSHRQLDVLPIEEAAADIGRSRAELERGLDGAVTTFAYPHGYSSPELRQSVRDAGFSAACSARHAVSHPDDDPYRLARVLIRHDTTVEQLEGWLAGRGIDRAVPGESIATRGWRLLRRARSRLDSTHTAAYGAASAVDERRR